ncbi:hypothetical protein TBLA_0A07200 [Henningerozyma blattae CBS 6284]|uniref:ATP synthase subunit epsilon, mitochondrial n=1 Tax=Henningerozyma blattae (strain ATCC 34711 / CBS 6284 / DSM 70876 / NBRC 10599 / NRRL Y-10934 / UCD 77-7) TaxID=1071380 RepID=I2GWK8_HENB6|nr:hypothetical protein TBLA_0A07200 [Tetrapisispora blattae CBS 6284]CCH58510.1 hypothetical protein TBLA_0A07200 [Tetrapisispora blattae CBS 6284]
MSAWRKAGITYNAYIAIAAKTVRNALKPELQTAAVIDRSFTEARFTKYTKGSPDADPALLKELPN